MEKSGSHQESANRTRKGSDPLGRLTWGIRTEAPGDSVPVVVWPGSFGGTARQCGNQAQGVGLKNPLVKAGQGCVCLKGKWRWPGAS